jgi:hypothetical protein
MDSKLGSYCSQYDIIAWRTSAITKNQINNWKNFKTFYKVDNKINLLLLILLLCTAGGCDWMRLYVMKHFQCLWTSHGSSAGSYACRKSHSALSAITNAHQALKPPIFLVIDLFCFFQSSLTRTITLNLLI